MLTTGKKEDGGCLCGQKTHSDNAMFQSIHQEMMVPENGCEK